MKGEEGKRDMADKFNDSLDYRSLSRYLKQISRFPSLTPEEERSRSPVSRR